jgi:lipopolysaccharide export system protein LptC
MNDAAPQSARRDRLNAIGVARENAVPDAVRHSARVARLRRLMLWSAGGVVGLVLIGLGVQALRFLPLDLRFARIGLKGSRITIETPRLVGYRKDGRPYELRAKVGIQDMATPDLFELNELEVRMDDGEKAIVLTAAKGLYNSKREHADLTGGVRIHDGKQFDMKLESAEMDFKSSVMSSARPVTLKIENGEVVAKAVEFSQKERRATFSGDVHSVFYGDSSADAGGDEPQQDGER